MLAAEADVAERLQRGRARLWELIGDLMASYADHRPVRKVAVVANAPLQPSEERAAEIDSADLVIRTNSLVLDHAGGPPCVGRACHVAVVSMATAMTPWVLQDYRQRLYLVPQAGWDVHPTAGLRSDLRLVAPFWPSDLGALPLPNTVVKGRLLGLLDPGRRPGSLLPTSGLMALYLAHEHFPDAELVATGYSFLHDDTQQSWAHHAGGSTRVHAHHDLSLEARLVRSWIAVGRLRMLP